MAIEWPGCHHLPRQPQLSFTEVTAFVMRTLRPLLPPSAATTTRCRPEARARSWHHTPGCASSCYSTTWTDQSSPWLTLCWYSCPHPDSNNNTILFSENYPLAKVSLFSVFETKLKGQRQRYQVLHQFHNVLWLYFKISFDILRILLYQWSWKKETMKMIWYLFVGKDEQRGLLEFLLLDELGKLVTRLGKTVPVTAVHHKYNSCNRQNNWS